MDEKTCETCKYQDKTSDELPCRLCIAYGGKWEPKEDDDDR